MLSAVVAYATGAVVVRYYTRADVTDVRLLDLLPELTELFHRKLTVVVVVESHDEVESSVLWITQLRPKNLGRLIEADEFLASTRNTTNHYGVIESGLRGSILPV